jgi:hypothetical protein
MALLPCPYLEGMMEAQLIVEYDRVEDILYLGKHSLPRAESEEIDYGCSSA